MKFTGRFKECISGFNYLEDDISESEAQKYYERWISKYRKHFSSECEHRTIAMAIRSQRAKREILTSAILFEEAKTAMNSGCVSATYFLLYYSLFHAMWSVLFLDSDQNENVTEVTHRKLGNVFCSSYGNNLFFNIEMSNYFIRMRDMRELFSYNVPYNMIGDKIDLDKFQLILLKCYQLANLHNEMLVSCTKKILPSSSNKQLISTYFEHYYHKDIDAEKDPAEYNLLREMLSWGVKIDSYEIEIGHDWDEMYYSEYIVKNFSVDKVMSIKNEAIRFLSDAISIL